MSEEKPKLSLRNEKPVRVQNVAEQQYITHNYGIPTIVVVILLIVGVSVSPLSNIKEILFHSFTPTNATAQPENISTTFPTLASTTSPTVNPATPINATTAMEIYNRYTNQPPSQEYTPLSNWTPSGYGTCQLVEGTQEYHAHPTARSVVACLAPPIITGSFAVQAKVTVNMGVGAALVFGYAPDYIGDYYYWSFCGYTGCKPPINAFLDHGTLGAGIACLGPHPDPNYSSGGEYYCTQNCCAINTNPGQPNILTAIVLQGEIYLYINAVFVVTFSPAKQQEAQQATSQVAWQTSGRVGFAALGSSICTCPTDVTLQYLKIWSIQD